MTEGKTVKAGAVRVTYEHGGQLCFAIGGFPAIMFNPAKASVENRHLAQMLGWKNRIGDGAAVSADPATGKVDPQAKYDRVKALVDFYEAGGLEWAMKAAAAPRDGAADAGLVLQALMNVKGWTLDATNAKVGKMAEIKGVERKAVLAGLAKDPAIIREVAEIKAKRAAESKLNVTAMLDEMDGLDDDDDDDGEDGPRDVADLGEAPM